jgi:DNA-binding NarL/FixJ family response regulator
MTEGNLVDARRQLIAALATAVVRGADPTPVMAVNNEQLLRSLETMAHLAVACGQPAHALRLIAFVRTRRERLGLAVPPSDARATEVLVDGARAVVGHSAIREEMFGRSMTLHEVIEDALSIEPPAPPEQRAAPDSLSTRERQVVTLITRGLTNREIASELVIADSTAERHVHNILAKLGVATRTQVAAWALASRLDASW